MSGGRGNHLIGEDDLVEGSSRSALGGQFCGRKQLVASCGDVRRGDTHKTQVGFGIR